MAASVVGIVGGQDGDRLLLDEGQGHVDAADQQRRIDGAVGRSVNVRRAIVAVDAVHALRRGLGDLRVGELRILGVVLGHAPLRSLTRTQGMTWRCSVGGDVVDLRWRCSCASECRSVCPLADLPPPVLISMRTSCGVFVSSYGVMGEDFQLRAEEFRRPVALLAGFLRRPQVLYRAGNRAGKCIEGGGKDLRSRKASTSQTMLRPSRRGTRRSRRAHAARAGTRCIPGCMTLWHTCPQNCTESVNS